MLDYGNCPHYTPAAWRITARAHVGPALDQLADPATARLRYQQEVLQDSLECGSPATPRLVSLVEGMIGHAARCKAESRPLAFPERMVPLESASVPRPRLGELYPENPSFSVDDVTDLQRSLALARQESRSWKRRAQLAMSLRQTAKRLLGKGDA